MVRIAAHAALYCAGDCAGKSAVAHAFQCSLPGTFPASGFYLYWNLLKSLKRFL